MSFLSDRALTNRAIRVALELDGVPMSQIEPLLKEARDIALASGVVQVNGQRFIEVLKELDSASA